MANLDLLVLNSEGAPKRTPSNAQTVDFTSVRVGADNLAIAQGGSGGSAYLDVSSRAIRSSATPSNGNDLVNKSYVDQFLNGITGTKNPVRVATAAALAANTPSGGGAGKTLTANANGALVVDGVTVSVGNRILVKDESSGANNGIYVVTATGDGSNPWVLTRATDFDTDAEVDGGCLVSAQEGTANADVVFMLTTNDPITIDTTSLTFVVYPTAITAGSGLSKTGNTLDVNTGDGTRIVSDAVVVDPTKSKTNDNASAITARQIVYVKANGNVDLAQKSISSLKNFALGIVEDSSIASAASGAIVLSSGYIMSGFSGLTPGREYCLSGTSGGIDLYENISYSAGDSVYKVGRAISATQLRFEPEHKLYY